MILTNLFVLTCTKIVQHAAFRGSIEYKGPSETRKKTGGCSLLFLALGAARRSFRTKTDGLLTEKAGLAGGVWDRRGFAAGDSDYA
jgi:hypothetical protein